VFLRDTYYTIIHSWGQNYCPQNSSVGIIFQIILPINIKRVLIGPYVRFYGSEIQSTTVSATVFVRH